MTTTIEDTCHGIFTELGSGHRECIYQNALAIELRNEGHHVDTECVIPIMYKTHYVGNIRCDIIVDRETVIECKMISKLGEKERYQIQQYLRTSGLVKGYLVNFGNKLEVEEYNAGDVQRNTRVPQTRSRSAASEVNI